MADILGLENKNKRPHRITNTLDGNLTLKICVDAARGETVVRVNGSEVCRADAGDGASPFLCGNVSLPRGEFTLEIESGCEIGKILIAEALDPKTPEDFDLLFMNRKRDWVFERDRFEYSPEQLAILRRHGFLFDQPNDTALGKAPSGVPLGGMGCGKLEITADGMLTSFTGNNNQDCPIYRIPGAFMALAEGENVRIIRSDPIELPYTPAQDISSDLEFPFARLHCSDPALGTVADIEAFSAHIPGNAADSALPCVFWEISLRNLADRDADAAFCFSWENIINVGGSMTVHNAGERLFPLCYHTWNCSYPWSDRRVNRCRRDGSSLLFYADDNRGNPSSFGEHLLWCSEPDAEGYPERSILPEDEGAFADIIAGKDAALPKSESEFRAGAWLVRRRLAPGQSASFRFALAWHMPTLLDDEGHDYGVEYANRFASAGEVLRYALAERDRLFAETKAFNDIINRSSLPGWFRRRLLDDRFVVNTCSWYDRDENFSVNEAPTGMAGCLGTLDQRTASQVYYTTFFPELDARELDLFRRSQAEDGMCAHEIGFAAIRLWARPFSKWPDLACSYVIQVFHHYQRTGDLEFLRLHWPHIVKAINWTLTLDDERCGIPFICPGRGTTYDNQFWEGVNAFIATMQLAAYRLGAAAARALGHGDISGRWDALADGAQKYRMEHLWNSQGRYFNNAYNPRTGEIDDSCFIAALAGDWAELRAGIAPELPRELIGKIASAITANCVGEHGISDQGGRRETTEGFMQYPMAYLASPALFGGASEAAWRFAEVNDRVLEQPGCSNHFDQALTYGFDGSRHGLPYYMTAPASWNMLEALSGLTADLGCGTLALAPYLDKGYRLPVFLTGCAFELICSASGGELRLEPIRSARPNSFTCLRVAGKWSVEGVCGRFDGCGTEFDIDFDPGRSALLLRRA